MSQNIDSWMPDGMAGGGSAGGGQDLEMKRRREKLMALLQGRLHWALILAVILAACGAVAGWSLHRDMYESSTAIEFVPVVQLPTSEDGPPPFFSAWMSQQLDMIKSSPDVVKTAMEEPAWVNHDRDPALPPMSAGDFLSALEIDEPGRQGYIARVTFQSEDPATAQAGAFAIVQAFKKTFDLRNNDEKRRQLNSLNSEMLKAEARLKEIEGQIDQEERGRQTSVLEQEWKAETARQTTLDNRKMQIDILIGGSAEQQLNSDEPLTPLWVRQNDPMALQLQEEIDQLEMQIRELISGGYRENHYAVQRLRNSQQAKRTSLERYVDDVVNGRTTDIRALPSELDKLREQRARIEDQLALVRPKVIDLGDKLHNIYRLRTERDDQAERVADIKNRRDAVQQRIDASDDIAGRVQVSPSAALPTKPANEKKQIQKAVMGGIAGFGMGFGLIIMAGLFDRRLRHAADARTGMPDVRMLGVLPTLPRNLKDPQQAETAAHSVHHIRTLLQIGTEEGRRVFTITSPAAGSGKSSLSVALGLSFAAAGSRTLLIDCDVVGAGLSRRLGGVTRHPIDMLIRAKGLLDDAVLDSAIAESTRKNKSIEEVLIDRDLLSARQIELLSDDDLTASGGVLEACEEGCLKECVATTDVQNLSVLPVGRARPNDAGALSPQALRRLIDQARAEFEVVLVDTGPVLGSLEASMAAAHSDGVIFIVSRGDAKGLVNKSLEHLQSIGTRVLGVVFNHANDSDIRDGSYGSLVSVDRRIKAGREAAPDPVTSARLGPLGSAVAAYSHKNGPQGSLSRNGHHQGVNGETEVPARALH